MIKNKGKQKPKFWIIIVLLILFLSIASHAYGGFFDENYSIKVISTDVAHNENPSIAVFKENIHIVWNNYPTEYISEIFYRKSQDNGLTWQDKLNLSLDSFKAVYPDIAVYQNNVHVVWSDYRNDNPEIYYVHSVDGGDNWSSQKRLTFNNSIKNNIYDIDIEVDTTNVYIVWKDYRSGSSEIFFKKSIDNGDTWSEDYRLTYDRNPSFYPCLTVDNDKVFVVYEDRSSNYNICLLKSLDNGDTWSEKVHVVDTQSVSEKPDIAIFDDSLFLVWQEVTSKNKEIMFQKSTDNGDTWQDAEQIADSSYLTINPKVFVYQNKIAVVWHEQHNNMFLIYYTTSENGGSTWSDNKELVSDMDCYTVEAGGEGYNLYLVWQRYNQAAWADILFMGNNNYTEIVNTTVVNYENVNSPGFDFTFVLIAFFIIFLTTGIYVIKKKRRC